ncbi:MAG: LacI family DNA-binding transcriptional regulator [Chthonomonadales bacterium]
MRNRTNNSESRTTARQIAAKLGVSQSTVSRVLSNAPGYQYSAETRRRILQEAERLAYRPHAVGRSLRERRTRVVGFSSCYANLDARNAFLAEIIGSLQSSCSRSGHFLLLHNFQPEVTPIQKLAELTCGRIDALVLHSPAEDPLVPLLQRSQLPVVAVADAIPDMPSVVCDDRGGIRMAVEHLEARGHSRIAFLAPTTPLASARAREAAYCHEMELRGWEPLRLLVEYEITAPALEQMMAMNPPPTAACCWNEVTALDLLHACRIRGIRVPEDLAIVGFDGLLDRRVMAKDLTTVVAGWPLVAETAIDVIHKLIKGENVPPVTTMPVTLHIGETT